MQFRIADTFADSLARLTRAVFICMSPIPHTAQAERNEGKSKPAPLRLHRLRGAVYPERSSTSALRAYAQNERKRRAQGERESNEGDTQVKIALGLFNRGSLAPYQPRRSQGAP